MTDTPDSLAARLATEGEKTAAFFRELAPDDWGLVVYDSEASWTLTQLLAHFVSTELGFRDLVANILSGGPGSPENFDIDRYNEKHVAELQAVNQAVLLDRYQAARRDNTALVQGMQPEDLERLGRHPFLGVVPLEGIIKLLYRHNQIHLRDVRRLMGPTQG